MRVKNPMGELRGVVNDLLPRPLLRRWQLITANAKCV